MVKVVTPPLNQFKLPSSSGDIVKFTKLRSLRLSITEQYSDNGDLVNAKLNVNTIVLLLETCTKLKFFELKCRKDTEDIATDDEEEQI